MTKTIKTIILTAISMIIGLSIGRFTAPPIYAMSNEQVIESIKLINSKHHFMMSALHLQHELDACQERNKTQ